MEATVLPTEESVHRFAGTLQIERIESVATFNVFSPPSTAEQRHADMDAVTQFVQTFRATTDKELSYNLSKRSVQQGQESWCFEFFARRKGKPRKEIK